MTLKKSLTETMKNSRRNKMPVVYGTLIGTLIIVLVFSKPGRVGEVVEPVPDAHLPVNPPMEEIVSHETIEPFAEISTTQKEISTTDVQDLIIEMALDYGVDVDTALRIAECESGYQWDAKNSASSATGVYQWLNSTWINIGSPGDRLNPEDNIRAFMLFYPLYPGWWVCK